MDHRVFISGMGMVSPLGSGVDINWKHILERKNMFTPHSIQRRKKVEEFHVGRVDTKAEENKYGQIAEDALIQSIKDSNADAVKKPGRYALIVGSSIGNCEYMSQSVKNKYQDLILSESFPEVLAHELSDKYSVNSMVAVINSACSSSTHAIGKAYRLIKNNLIDCAYVIGVDAVLSDIGLTSFASLGVLSTEKYMRPFDVRHNGFILSEGAGALVLQSEDFLKKYHGHSYGEICGYGTSCDAYHIVAPDPSGRGATLAMEKALREADLHSGEIDYINCHGTGTKLNDESEYSAMEAIFKDPVMASSTKGITGHLLGACGIIETIFSCLTLKNNLMPATANLVDPIKNGNIHILAENLKEEVKIVMNNTFAFGGQNASLIIKK